MLVGEIARLTVPIEELDDQADLFAAGMSSIDAVALVVALESRFSFQFHADAMSMDTFRSIASISNAAARTQRNA